MQKLATILPRFCDFLRPVTAPVPMRLRWESVSISVWIPRSFLSSRMQDRIRDPSNPHLNRGAVLYQCGNVSGYPLGDRTPLRKDYLKRRFVIFHEVVKLRQMKEAVPERSRHLGIYLGDNHMGRFDSALIHAYGNSHGAEAMLIGWTHLHKRDVELPQGFLSSRCRAPKKNKQECSRQDRRLRPVWFSVRQRRS